MKYIYNELNKFFFGILSKGQRISTFNTMYHDKEYTVLTDGYIGAAIPSQLILINLSKCSTCTDDVKKRICDMIFPNTLENATLSFEAKARFESGSKLDVIRIFESASGQVWIKEKLLKVFSSTPFPFYYKEPQGNIVIYNGKDVPLGIMLRIKNPTEIKETK